MRLHIRLLIGAVVALVHSTWTAAGEDLTQWVNQLIVSLVHLSHRLWHLTKNIREQQGQSQMQVSSF